MKLWNTGHPLDRQLYLEVPWLLVLSWWGIIHLYKEALHFGLFFFFRLVWFSKVSLYGSTWVLSKIISKHKQILFEMRIRGFGREGRQMKTFVCLNRNYVWRHHRTYCCYWLQTKSCVNTNYQMKFKYLWSITNLSGRRIEIWKYWLTTGISGCLVYRVYLSVVFCLNKENWYVVLKDE